MSVASLLAVAWAAPIAWAASPYPVNPQVHVHDKSKDALDATTFEPKVGNGFAYARSAADIVSFPADVVRASGTKAPESVDEVFDALAHQASALSEESLLAVYASEATPEDVETLVRSLALPDSAGAHGDTLPPPQDLVRRLAHLARQRKSCGLEKAARGQRLSDRVAACCRALALPYALLPEWSRQSDAERAVWSEAARTQKLRPLLKERALAEGFRLQGLKAWHAGCAQRLEKIPLSLDGLKSRVGDYHAEGWPSDYHPASRAKGVGRRMFRDTEKGVNIAETMDGHCTVLETEVVWRRASGRLSFASYGHDGKRIDHGYFSGGSPGKAAVKFTPDSCMGCHYTFDERRFDVAIPSFLALHLETPPGFWRGGRGGEACVRAGDSVVRHTTP